MILKAISGEKLEDIVSSVLKTLSYEQIINREVLRAVLSEHLDGDITISYDSFESGVTYNVVVSIRNNKCECHCQVCMLKGS